MNIDGTVRGEETVAVVALEHAAANTTPPRAQKDKCGPPRSPGINPGRRVMLLPVLHELVNKLSPGAKRVTRVHHSETTYDSSLRPEPIYETEPSKD